MPRWWVLIRLFVDLAAAQFLYWPLLVSVRGLMNLENKSLKRNAAGNQIPCGVLAYRLINVSRF